MPATISKALLVQLSSCLDREMGLSFPQARWADLQRGIRSVASELGFETAEECAEWLLSRRLSKPQLELLAAHLTVGETYFFRDPAVFEFLERRVLPDLLRSRRANGRQLRIWSAACCTGEEPYSLAISLSRLLPDIADWRITLLATDVNPRFLKKASEARYGNWSFRGASNSVREQYFHRASDGTDEIALSIRKMVSFATMNLAEDVYPSLMSDTNAMDVIFCRNVLMYFSREQAAKVACKLHRCLVSGGWLFTSPTEMSRDTFPQFEVEHGPGVLALRKIEREGVSRRSSGAAQKRAAADVVVAPPVVASVPAAKIRVEEGARIGKARNLANEGRLVEALAECDRVIEADKLDAAGHYLRGMILLEKGAFTDSREALRRALFLDHDLIVAHFALGNLFRRLGRPSDAARSLENARALLQKLDPHAELPESDGVTAGRLLAMVESIQDLRV